ncbi:MAG: hypothetical protein ACLQDQ_05270 [Myxococcaceae bacterium]
MTWYRSLLAAAVVALLAHSGLAAADTEPASTDWPRQIDSVAGTIVVYEPQPEALQGSVLNGRAAFSLTPKGKTDPIFGAFWFTANVNIDRDQRVVRVLGVKVTRLRLPDATDNDEKSFAADIENETPKWDLSLSLDGLTAALAQVQEERTASDDLQAAPPKVLFATQPTVLVVLDGQPIRKPIEKSGIESVVNTPYPLFYDPRAQRYYLTNGAIWYQTADLIAGPWQVIPQPPPEVAAVVLKGDKQDQAAPPPKDTPPPAVLVATEPTELLVSDGAPNFAPISGTQLLYVTNSEDNIFRELATQKLFVVLAGRWYSGPGFEGPWSFVRSDQLPPDFTRIPPTSPKGDVLAFVSATPQAKEAVIDAQIPQTAEVKRDAPPPPIQYDGQPNFQPIPSTSMSYAVNTPNSVLQIDGAYYACVNAVWYVAPSPQGPWTVATSVPQAVQTIPPSSPVYNVKYVTIYQATPQVVYVGYTPGYTGCYTWNGAVVYGTGYVYPAYVSPVVYYPRPVTWGFSVSYNPYGGWSYGVGVSSGFLYFGTTWGGAYYRPPWRPPYGGGWYGPGGYRPPYYGPGYGYGRPPPPGYRPPYGGYPGGRPPYGGYPGGRPPQASLYQRPSNANAVVAQRPAAPSTANRPATRPSGPNNVYADKNGNVMRQTQDGNWQQKDKSGWKPASSTGAPGQNGARPSPGTPSAGGTPGTRPATPQNATRPASGGTPTQRPSNPSARPAPSNISSDYQARQRGNERNQNYQNASRQAPKAQQPKQQAPRSQAPKQSQGKKTK